MFFKFKRSKVSEKRPRILIRIQQIWVAVDLLHQSIWITFVVTCLDIMFELMQGHLLLVQYVRPIIISFILAKSCGTVDLLYRVVKFWRVNKVILAGWKFDPLIACLSLTRSRYTQCCVTSSNPVLSHKQMP